MEVVGDALDGLLVGVVVPDHLELAVLAAADQRVGAELVGIPESLELGVGHVGGVEIGAERAVAIAFYERFAVQAVPGAVVDQGEDALGVGRELGQGGLVPEALVPVDVVDLAGDQLIVVEDLDAVVGNARERLGADLDGGVGIKLGLDGVRLGLAGGEGGKAQEGEYDFFHKKSIFFFAPQNSPFFRTFGKNGRIIFAESVIFAPR